MATGKQNPAGTVISPEHITQSILYLRGHKVILDADLAILYGIETKVLLQAINRNRERFPEDFSFLLTKQEIGILRSQTVTSRWGGRRHPPHALPTIGILGAFHNVLLDTHIPDAVR